MKIEHPYSLPHSSATAERVFSQLNLMKTKVRNSLLVDTCDGILHSKDLLDKNQCFFWKPSDNLIKMKFK
ncbi:hypothetical protein NQ315_002609 [Exocentrus adspersus]|uniref:HAT C-terminal dimerisation domain-containing protein n=1 Tax=Exocentrus adspersus TaxID=1586481 RepID=A0AAV8VVI7_9CUCU|nr:hypothetical protein NQ315_002609 [Exocentrus adspersus]